MWRSIGGVWRSIGGVARMIVRNTPPTQLRVLHASFLSDTMYAFPSGHVHSPPQPPPTSALAYVLSAGTEPPQGAHTQAHAHQHECTHAHTHVPVSTACERSAEHTNRKRGTQMGRRGERGWASGRTENTPCALQIGLISPLAFPAPVAAFQCMSCAPQLSGRCEHPVGMLGLLPVHGFVAHNPRSASAERHSSWLVIAT